MFFFKDFKTDVGVSWETDYKTHGLAAQKGRN